jgi:hypothetical protein
MNRRRLIFFVSVVFLAVVALTAVWLFIFSTKSIQKAGIAPTISGTQATPTFTAVPIRTGKVEINFDEVLKDQGNIQNGTQIFRSDPLQVAKEDGENYGFSADDSFVLLQQFYDQSLGTFAAQVRVFHGGTNYLVMLKQPKVKGAGGAWKIYEIKEE